MEEEEEEKEEDSGPVAGCVALSAGARSTGARLISGSSLARAFSILLIRRVVGGEGGSMN